MFFHISRTVQNNFPNNHQTKHFVLNLDEGWTQYSDGVWGKGYLDQGILAEHILDICEETVPSRYGNFCIIKVTDDSVEIKTDILRSFPIWYDYEKGVTNLYVNGAIQWTCDLVRITKDWVLEHSKFDPVGPIDDSILTIEQVTEKVDDILNQKTLEFLKHQTFPIRVFLSGGIDTALVFSYIQKHTKDYQLVLNLHTDLDYFYLKNHSRLKEFWGYTQIHHWNEDCVLASGAPGDEFTARSPTTANLLLLHYGTSIPELLANSSPKDSLHYSYYNQKKYLDTWAETAKTYTHQSLVETIRTCCDYNVNDWQHWHLGRTLTWTPLRDLEMFKLFARLKFDDLKQQVMNSSVQLRLIEKNNPEILSYLSTQKNSVNYMENLVNLLD